MTDLVFQCQYRNLLGYRSWPVQAPYPSVLNALTRVPWVSSALDFDFATKCPPIPVISPQSLHNHHHLSTYCSYFHSHSFPAHPQHLYSSPSQADPVVPLRALLATLSIAVCGLKHDCNLLNRYYLLITQGLPCLSFWVWVTSVRWFLFLNLCIQIHFTSNISSLKQLINTLLCKHTTCFALFCFFLPILW